MSNTSPVAQSPASGLVQEGLDHASALAYPVGDLPFASDDALYVAVTNGDLARVAELISAHSRTSHDYSLILQVLVDLEETPARVECLKRLLAAGADPEFKNGLPLIRCAKCGNTAFARALLDAGARVTTRKSEAIKSAVDLGRADSVALLLDYGADIELDSGALLARAADEGNENVVRLLLQRGADPDAGEGRALWEACYGRHVGVGELLLDAGADVSLGSYSALIVAAGRDALDIVRLVLQQHALPADVLDQMLLQAARHNRVDMCTLLLNAGADPLRRVRLTEPNNEPLPSARQAAKDQGHGQIVALFDAIAAKRRLERAVQRRTTDRAALSRASAGANAAAADSSQPEPLAGTIYQQRQRRL